MNKTTLPTLFILSSIFTTPLFASNFFHKLIPSRTPNQVTHLHAKKQTKQHNSNYTNFSGSWSGGCSINDYPEIPMDLTIENDAEYFSIDGEEFSIGPLHTKGISGESNTAEFEHAVLEWNQDRSMLTVKSMSFEKYRDIKSNTTEISIMKMAIYLDNGKLIMKGQDIDLEQEIIDLTCTFTKK
ncbi:hypothetical protein ACQUW5_11600 [Legionella sp. CNM-1927-20]|uniref:hypothetical protein n=1 Tax=Legionella sp. CNM-1927-20 TaxID=3422221 RepID=UPI00403B11D5